MKHKVLSFLTLLTLSSVLVNGQSLNNNIPKILESLYLRLTNSESDQDRIIINDSIITIIDSYVKSDSVFKHKFNNIRSLGQIKSPDNLIKILTWNMALKNSKSRYFCYFIMKKGGGKDNQIYKLSAYYAEETIRTDTVYFSHNWYGALYYDIRPSISEGKKCWILLGIDYGNPLISRKIIEVLSYTPDDSLIFGKKLFVSDVNIRYRDVFQYSATAIMSLRFSSGKSIIFDHLVPFSPELKDNHQFYGPDYSYDAYRFAKGLWKLTINVDARNKK
jgi:hypothetical protein